MAFVAPLSRYKKRSFVIWLTACIVLAGWFAYDGYLSKYEWSLRYSFYKKHVVDNGGKPDSDMVFNQKAPPYFVGAAVLLGAYIFIIRNRRVVAEDNALVINGKINIAYDTIKKIDKTDFESKGRFTITYRGPDGKDTDRKISDRDYDNLGAVLEHLVAKIS